MIVARASSPADDFIALFRAAEAITTEIMVPLAAKRGEGTRTGGWFALWRQDPNIVNRSVPMLGFATGYRHPDDYSRYIYFANEKANRLGSDRDGLSSWQSRDVESLNAMERKYGGAIRVRREFVFSFSGFSEHEDEMLCVLVAERLGMVDEREIDRITAVSDNVPLREYTERRRNFRA